MFALAHAPTTNRTGRNNDTHKQRNADDANICYEVLPRRRSNSSQTTPGGLKSRSTRRWRKHLPNTLCDCAISYRRPQPPELNCHPTQESTTQNTQTHRTTHRYCNQRPARVDIVDGGRGHEHHDLVMGAVAMGWMAKAYRVCVQHGPRASDLSRSCTLGGKPE